MVEALRTGYSISPLNDNLQKGMLIKMKKILSLFLSLMLVFSMCAGTAAVQASSSDATLVNLVFDTTDKAYSEYNSVLSSHLTVNYMTKEAYASDENAFQIRSTRPEKTMRFTIASPDVNGANPTSGVYVLSGKMLGNKAKSDGTIDFSGAKVQLNRTSGGNTAEANPAGLTANTWLDFSYTVDLDDGVFTAKYRNPADEEGVYEFESVDEFASGTEFKDLYFQLLYNDSASAVAFKDLKYMATTDSGVAGIISVNGGNTVEARQKNLSFTLSEAIPGLHPEHITATPLNGGNVNVASSVSVEDEGSECVVNAVFAQRFTENLTYVLEIDSSVYDGYKLMGADGTISDISAEGLSMNFDIGDYTISTEGTGKLVYSVYDTVGKKFSGYTKVTEYSTSNNFQPKYMEGGAATTLTSVNVNNTVRDNGTDGSMILQRLNKGNAARDMYFTYNNPVHSGTTPIGKYIISGKFFTNKAKADSTLADLSNNELKLNSNSSPHAKHAVTGLDANVWYDFVYEIDLTVSPATFKVTYTAENETTPDYSQTKTFTTGVFTSIRSDVEVSDDYTSFTPNGNYVKYKDLKMEAHLDKAKILSVNSDAAVAPNQNLLSFTIDNVIPGLASNPGNIWVEDASQKENKVTAVTVSGTQAPYTVNLTLENKLDAWTDYKLILSEGIYEGYGEINTDGDLIVPVPMPDDEFTRVFSVASTGFDIRVKSVTSDADGISYEFEYTNDSSNCEPMVFVKTGFDANGRNVAIETNEVSDLPVNGETKTTTQYLSCPDGGYAKIFSVNGLDGLVPQFGRAWTHNYTAKEAIGFVSSDGITLSDFDYENKKIGFGLVSGADKAVSGAIFVYSENPFILSYADYITTAQDGSFGTDLLFADSIDNETETYKVAFYSSELSEPLFEEFTCYDKEDRDQQKRDGILNQVKASTNVATLIQAIKGTDSNDEVVNDNFDVFSDDANMSYYNKLKNKNAVFSIMLSSVSSVESYDDIVTSFEKAAKKQYDKENPKSSGGGGGGSAGSDNRNYGSSSTVISERVDTPVVSQPDSENSNTTWKNPFADMTGHWAEEFAAELSNRGIMSGYPDGSFKGEASITRAELAKTIMEALDIQSSSGKTFTDVSSASWYAQYVSAAAGAGIINGFEDGSFGPDVAVNRQDAVLMLYRALGKIMEMPTGYTFFKDDFDIDDYASDAVRCLGELGIVRGDANVRFNPKNSITRAEVTAIICRALDYVESH